MTATLRVVLDQAVAATDDDLRSASVDLARALVATTPKGAEVAAIVPADAGDVGSDIPGLAHVDRVPLKRAQMAAAASVGVVPGVGGGMIHSPTLLAPLVRHDRVHDHDQTVVTLWSLEPWTHPERLSRGSVAWHRAMLKRAVKHADAVVVPTHAMARELAERTKLGGRVRVISGAVAPVVPRGAGPGVGSEIVIDAARASADELETALHAVAGITEATVTLLAADGEAEAGDPMLEVASAAGMPEHRVRLAAPGYEGRAAAIAGAGAFVDLSAGLSFPWRMLEALAAGIPVVAASSAQNAEVLADAGQLVAVDGVDPLVSTLRRILGDTELATRLKVLSLDRAKAFSWDDTAQRVWQLHADL
jgi:glycosyltransferase involved in cell wall biosynthesis